MEYPDILLNEFIKLAKTRDIIYNSIVMFLRYVYYDEFTYKKS